MYAGGLLNPWVDLFQWTGPSTKRVGHPCVMWCSCAIIALLTFFHLIVHVFSQPVDFDVLRKPMGTVPFKSVKMFDTFNIQDTFMFLDKIWKQIRVYFSRCLSMVELLSSSSMSTSCLVSLRGAWAIFCDAGSGRIGRARVISQGKTLCLFL